ncbi:MAG: sigma-54-dependent transcriptional regulator [Ignavibacteria bacterium]
MKNFNILLVDDEVNQLDILSGFLRKKGYKVFTSSSGMEGINIFRNNLIDIVLSDFKMPDKNGLEVFEEIKKINPEAGFIMITAHGTVENAVKAMRMGAEDYISKPIDLDELELVMEKLIENRKLKSENLVLKNLLQEKSKIDSVIHNSPKMQEVISIAARVADSKASVLITGESGTGKEVLAKAIHLISGRRNNAFIAVNIHALAENLLESELFGHEKGSYTGADKMRKGRFELADNGTIFLDEVGDIPVGTQVKLLRVLQEHQFERVGGTEIIDVDVRVIAATNQDLQKKIKEGVFREDLFYRLNVVNINIPPLRERKEDILPLIDTFIKKYCEENNKERMEVTKEAADTLLKYNYPGNVRELENIIERSVVLSRSRMITAADLPLVVKELNHEKDLKPDAPKTLNEKVEELEKRLIYDALKEANGNQTKAGKILGLTERNLRYKLQKYNIRH